MDNDFPVEYTSRYLKQCDLVILLYIIIIFPESFIAFCRAQGWQFYFTNSFTRMGETRNE